MRLHSRHCCSCSLKYFKNQNKWSTSIVSCTFLHQSLNSKTLNLCRFLTRSSAIAEGPCDTLVSIEILQLRNVVVWVFLFISCWVCVCVYACDHTRSSIWYSWRDQMYHSRWNQLYRPATTKSCKCSVGAAQISQSRYLLLLLLL